MNSTLKKNFSKLGQWTGEKLSKEERIDVNDQFKSLLTETENKRVYTDNLQAALHLYITQQLKKKDSTDNSKNKVYIAENFANALLQLGEVLPRDSVYGKALKSFGQTQIKLSNLQTDYSLKAREDWICTLEQENNSFKEFAKLSKKFETRRADYDSKNKKLIKSKKEGNGQLQDDLRSAKIKYDDTYNEMVLKMQNFQDFEAESLKSLHHFYLAQLEYHRKACESLESLDRVFQNCLGTYRAPARERLTSMRNNAAAHFMGSASVERQGSTYPQRNNIPQFNNRSNNTQHPYSPSDDDFNDFDDHSYSKNQSYNHGNSDENKINPAMASQLDYSTKPAATVIPARRAPPPPPVPKDKPESPKTHRRAMYEFKPSGPGELGLQIGDVVEVSEKIDEGWWSGTVVKSRNQYLVGNKGIFPVNYTEEFDHPSSYNTPTSLSSAASTPRNNLSNLQYQQPSNVSPTFVTKAASSPDSHLHRRQHSVQANQRYEVSKLNREPSTHSQTHDGNSPAPKHLARNQTMPALNSLNDTSNQYESNSRKFIPGPAIVAKNFNNDNNQQTAGALGIVADCSVCGCDDYSPNLFKKESCNNCFHKH